MMPKTITLEKHEYQEIDAPQPQSVGFPKPTKGFFAKLGIIAQDTVRVVGLTALGAKESMRDYPVFYAWGPGSCYALVALSAVIYRQQGFQTVELAGVAAAAFLGGLMHEHYVDGLCISEHRKANKLKQNTVA